MHPRHDTIASSQDRPGTLFYLDPPYLGTEGYEVEFGVDQYAVMADLARSVQGRIVISVNDCPEMRATLAGLPMDQLPTCYSLRNRQEASGVPSSELLIRNF